MWVLNDTVRQPGVYIDFLSQSFWKVYGVNKDEMIEAIVRSNDLGFQNIKCVETTTRLQLCLQLLLMQLSVLFAAYVGDQDQY